MHRAMSCCRHGHVPPCDPARPPSPPPALHGAWIPGAENMGAGSMQWGVAKNLNLALWGVVVKPMVLVEGV
jgi:hypothetical protein